MHSCICAFPRDKMFTISQLVFPLIILPGSYSLVIQSVLYCTGKKWQAYNTPTARDIGDSFRSANANTMPLLDIYSSVAIQQLNSNRDEDSQGYNPSIRVHLFYWHLPSRAPCFPGTQLHLRSFVPGSHSDAL